MKITEEAVVEATEVEVGMFQAELPTPPAIRILESLTQDSLTINTRYSEPSIYRIKSSIPMSSKTWRRLITSSLKSSQSLHIREAQYPVTF